MTTPLSAVREGLVKAHLEVLRPIVPVPIIPLRFNPTQYELEKGNSFAEIAIPGLEIAAAPVRPRQRRDAEHGAPSRHLRHPRGRPRSSTPTSCAG